MNTANAKNLAFDEDAEIAEIAVFFKTARAAFIENMDDHVVRSSWHRLTIVQDGVNVMGCHWVLCTPQQAVALMYVVEDHAKRRFPEVSRICVPVEATAITDISDRETSRRIGDHGVKACELMFQLSSQARTEV